MNREQMMAKLAGESIWDVLVIGGGATGLGTALEAASRGYRTALLEAHDFAKGTSSRSTKLIHGGVRYLRSGQVGMVRESLLERGRLLRNASHVVHPMRFIIPAYRRGRRWYYFAGMKAYDLLAGSSHFSPSRMLTADQTYMQLPTLNKHDLRGGVEYCDGQFDDSRLAISLAATTAEHGGVVTNYTRVTRIESRNGRVTGVSVRDEETQHEYQLTAKVVINATGVFAESIMQLDPTNDSGSAPKVVPSQGTHLVVDRRFLPSSAAIMIPDTDDGRVLFAIPWHGRTLIGTTDHEVNQITLEPRPLESEVNYLLEHAGRYLTPAPQLADVLSAFAGLRPLVGKGDANSSSASLSREHEIYTSPGGLVSVIGGKWTTYRKMGEDVVNLAATMGGLANKQSITSNLRLAGCPEEVPDFDAHHQSSLAVYGTNATGLLELVRNRPDLGDRLHERLPYLKAEVVWAARYEMARSVEDVLARRTRSLLLDAQAAIEAAPTVAVLLKEELQRDAHWHEDQIAQFSKIASGYLA